MRPGRHGAWLVQRLWPGYGGTSCSDSPAGKPCNAYINEYASLMMFAEEFERFAVRKYTNFAQIKYLKEAKGKCLHSCIALSLYLLLLR